MLLSRFRLLLTILIVLGSFLVVGVLLTTLQQPAIPVAAVASSIPATISLAASRSVTPQSATADVAATVNGETISWADWQRLTALDRAMSQLAKQPPPDAETTLQRLINERLVLQPAGAGNLTASDQQVQDRLTFLKQTWQVDDAALDRTLTLNGLSRADLI